MNYFLVGGDKSLKCSECDLDANQEYEGRFLCSRCLLYTLIQHDAKTGDETASRMLDLAATYSHDILRQKDYVACVVEVAETAVKTEKLVISLLEAGKIAKKWKIDGPIVHDAAVRLGYAIAG